MKTFLVWYYNTVISSVRCESRADAARHIERRYGGQAGLTITEAQPLYNPDIACVLEPDGYFRAIDLDNYDVDCDHTGFFTKSPTGFGRTPLDAIVDLLDETDACTTQ